MTIIDTHLLCGVKKHEAIRKIPYNLLENRLYDIFLIWRKGAVELCLASLVYIDFMKI